MGMVVISINKGIIVNVGYKLIVLVCLLFIYCGDRLMQKEIDKPY